MNRQDCYTDAYPVLLFRAYIRHKSDNYQQVDSSGSVGWLSGLCNYTLVGLKPTYGVIDAAI